MVHYNLCLLVGCKVATVDAPSQRISCCLQIPLCDQVLTHHCRRSQALPRSPEDSPFTRRGTAQLSDGVVRTVSTAYTNPLPAALDREALSKTGNEMLPIVCQSHGARGCTPEDFFYPAPPFQLLESYRLEELIHSCAPPIFFRSLVNLPNPYLRPSHPSSRCSSVLNSKEGRHEKLPQTV